ncbi:TIM-barrel domain-containing protein [Streptomyces sp. CBMA29]|uniref:TIM-barrel domain-containing protein n=1 Tax=Streptomyces sp. CBMA29 TaxID=1896314 RepID=UPI00397FE4D7|nr:alpha-xylosidase [Streptomyces sp. CBMA29]
MIVGGSGASAAPPSRAKASAVVSGDARFEILSPTLIRTEYAGDTAFLDAPTFNAVGRDGFGGAPFTQRVSDGWLTLTTQALTLKYKVGSGPFTGQNLTVRLKSGRQDVTAAPWKAATASTCAPGTLCEAESLKLNGVSAASDHTGYTGSGFAAGFENTGDSLSFTVTVPSDGTYQFDARYANSLGGDGQTATRTLTLSADGGAGRTVTLPTTADWNTWAVATASVDLTAGTHTLTLARTATDSGDVNIDSLAVVTPGSPYPGAGGGPAGDCAYGAVCEAEAGGLGGSAAVQEDHNDFSGKGFVAGLQQGASDTVHLTGVPAAGSYALQLRYSNAQSAPGTVAVTVGTGSAATTTLPVTSSWDDWRTVAVPVTLAAGTNDVTIGCPGADSCKVNLDTVAVTSTGSPLLAPHAPLGGYRRGLDGINGSPRNTPGLMYQDGWSLLDDTASAVFDNAKEKVTPRAGHGGKPYQDGYVFGYGHDYQRGLADLATLTGPSKLLPRWAYGVWYSEYYDRSAADYENTILPKFRADNVPLDVLVTDTDFKSPDRWDGWEIDSGRFPDPKGFFDWAAAQGLHNTLNIHPSILSSDPQFAQAQATSQNRLTKDNAGCYSDLGHGADCYTFDWGDPNQLKAYFDLHKTMEQQGADFWWLDWCCEQSKSTLAGVTPDAWINEQYAADTDSTVNRGFAFSRAYGSLQTGGYSGRAGLATGPWADKRTTVHFTGDTRSTWAMLQAEVGYTPGESVATGLSAVSHDIGGFNNDGTQAAGAEPGSTKLADDLYARWVQLGTFQPIDRLHSNHSDRLPWQYGAAAKTSAEKFLNLREALLPYTYTLAEEARRTGVPVARPAYLAYPEEQDAYATAGGEYLYGPDVLVAPVTTPGTTATTSVWFPPGSQWTDYFTGTTYQGGTTRQVATDLNSMPVFVKAGAILPTRTGYVANDVQNPLTKVTLNVPTGAAGSFRLYEDDGTTTDSAKSATTAIRYSQSGGRADTVHTLTVAPVSGSFAGQVAQRQWTVAFSNATAPKSVTVDGAPPARSAWSWDAAARKVTVTVPQRSVRQRVTVSYR